MFSVQSFVSWIPVIFLPVVSLQLIEHEVDHNEIKCLVCKKVVNDIESAVANVSPTLKVQKGFRIDASGDQKEDRVEYRRSELFLTETLEKICDKMEDYVKAKHKETGKIILMSLVGEGGQMNPTMSEVDIIQDMDLNRNLKLYCEEIVENHDEDLIEHFQSKAENGAEKICSRTTNICPDESLEQDFGRDEL